MSSRMQLQQLDSTIIVGKTSGRRHTVLLNPDSTRLSSSFKQPIVDQVVRKRGRTTTVMKVVPSSALIRRAKAAKPSIQSDEDSASVEEVVAVRKTHPGKENNNARKQSNTSSLQQAMDQTAEMSTPECFDIRVKYIQKKKLEIEQLKVVRDGRLKEQAKIDADVRISQNQFEIVRLIHAHRSEEWEHEDSDSLLECRLRKVMELQKEVGLLRTNVDHALDRLVTLICQELDSEEDVLDQMRESPLKLDEAGSTDLKLLFQDLVGRFLTDQSLLYAAKYHPILIYMLGSIGLISFEENSPERIALAFNRI